jgi:hypothetical protein
MAAEITKATESEKRDRFRRIVFFLTVSGSALQMLVRAARIQNAAKERA